MNLYTIQLTCTILGISGLLFPVILDFSLSKHSRPIVSQEKMRTKAFSILVFFIAEGLLIYLQFGSFWISHLLEKILIISGAIIILIGSLLNCIGRYQLGVFWSDENTVYKDHRLITTGLYAYIRHPLFTALLCLSLGAGMMFCNYVVMIATVAVLAPALYFRSRKEEQLLLKHFKEYADYKKKVSMFFPVKILFK
jgi:protein-S-isoprenylcysteine O-methyltransferase Ste14